jgi:hypothetical protein
MAFHFPCDDSEANETNAIEELKNCFGSEWLLFTNIPQYIAGKEIDSCLIGPRGMVVLELKNHRGLIVCSRVGDWAGIREGGNPLAQAGKCAQRLKSYLTDKDAALQGVFVDYLVVMTNDRCDLEVDAGLEKEFRVSRLSEAVGLVDGRLRLERRNRGLTLDTRRRIFDAIVGKELPAKLEAEWNRVENRPRPDPIGVSDVRNNEAYNKLDPPPAPPVTRPPIVNARPLSSPNLPGSSPSSGNGIKVVILLVALIGIAMIVVRQWPNGRQGSEVTQSAGLKSPTVTVSGLDKDRNILPSGDKFPPSSTVLIEATYTGAVVGRDEMQISIDWDTGSASCSKTVIRSIAGMVRCEVDDLKEGAYTAAVLGGKKKLWEVHFDVELPTVRFDGKQAATFRNGELEVLLTSEPDGKQGKRAIAVGKYKDRPAFALRAELGGSTSALKFLRVDPTSSNAHVIFSSFSGGAHCCTETQFASADSQGSWYVVNGRIIDGEVGYEFKDLDGDGTYELVSSDNDFLYAFGCYACSTMPPRIEKLIGQKFVNVTRDVRYQKFLREALKRMETRADSNSRSNGYLGGWVASKSLVGEFDDAWRKMLASYDPSSDEKTEECLINVPLTTCPPGQKRMPSFPEALLKLLVKNGYVTQGQAALLRAAVPKPPLSLVPENRIVDGGTSLPRPSEPQVARPTTTLSQGDLPKAGPNAPFGALLAAANNGDPRAQNSVGVMYHMGWGSPQNDLEAAKWFRRGADQGYAASETWLGTMYRNGWGVPKNEIEARRLYKLAAEQGNGPAKNALADPLYNTQR